jgi:hypothetical protein
VKKAEAPALCLVCTGSSCCGRLCGGNDSNPSGTSSPSAETSSRTPPPSPTPGTTATPAAAVTGTPTAQEGAAAARYDIAPEPAGDNVIDITDMAKLASFFGKGCTP